jgi:type I restriction enzyme S subunit
VNDNLKALFEVEQGGKTLERKELGLKVKIMDFNNQDLNKTTFGKINFPDDWGRYRLKDLLYLVRRTVDMENNRTYKLITVKRNFGGAVSRGELYGNQIKVKNQQQICENDFVISKRQISHGACAIIPDYLEEAIVSNEYHILHPVEDKLDINFFSRYVQQPFMKRYFYISSDGVHIEKLLFKVNDWFKKKVIIPPFEEQQKIADILSGWDKAIELKEKLIEQKKEEKKGFMQKLMTGEMRLPGFEGEWEKGQLGDLLENIVGGGTPSRKSLNYYNGNIPWATVKDMLDENYKDSTQEYITQEAIVNSSTKIIKADNFIISTRMGLGRGFINTVDMAINQDLKGLYPDANRLTVKYLMYWYRCKQFQFENQGAGSTVKGINLISLKKMSITYPKISEQKKITDVLCLVDKEIELLLKELQRLKQQKKGLMQLLLTGKVRVKV